MHLRFTFSWPKLGFLVVHLVALSAFYYGVTWQALGLCAFMFLIRKFGITGAYHRYFSHRSYKTSRWFQFCLAFLGGMAAQKGALWWASHHRHHHRHSDTEEDLHSADKEGFIWSHLGWVMSDEYDKYDASQIKDLTKYPELVFLNKHHFIPPVAAALFCYAVGGWMGLLWGFFISTVILYHTTFAINSFCHVFGNRRYETGEESKNCWWLAILTLGEGWHNNHHHFQAAARNGFMWWEFDPTYYTLLTLEKLGLVWELRAPPPKLYDRKNWIAKDSPLRDYSAASNKAKEVAAPAKTAEREPAGVA